jgi:hypothetical protein
VARTRGPPDLRTPASCTGKADQTGTAGRCRKDLGPGRQIVSQDSPDGISRIGGQPGTQAPDPPPLSSQDRGSRAGSIIHSLPAESAIEDCQVQMSRMASISAIPARSPSRGSKSYDWAARVYEQPLIPGDHDRERPGDPARGSATVPHGVGAGGAALGSTAEPGQLGAPLAGSARRGALPGDRPPGHRRACAGIGVEMAPRSPASRLSLPPRARPMIGAGDRLR